jgi:hypothetical protein
MNTETIYEYQEIKFAELTENMRRDKLEKLKKKMAKKGWELDSFHNNPLPKSSIAKFKRDMNQEAKTKENRETTENTDKQKTVAERYIFSPIKKNKTFLFYMFIILIFANIFIDNNQDNQQKHQQEPATKITQPKNIYFHTLTLKDYKEGRNKDELIEKLLGDKTILGESFENCIGDLAYNKSPEIKLKDALGWCINESQNNKVAFFSHINELKLRESGLSDIEIEAKRTERINKVNKAFSKKKNITYNKNHASLVTSFAYALQAGMLCDNLKMRLDTREKIENYIGTTTTQSIYSQDYARGLNSAFEDNDKGILCEEAWKHFGCYGDVNPRLIQENPFKLSNPILCEY